MSFKIKIIENTLLSQHWFVLRKIVYDMINKNGGSQRQIREVNRPGFIGIKNLKVMHVSSKGKQVYQRRI